ncbi:MAG: glucosamine-6-phosphate deaminase [Verrucomicrobiaceae bacterium]
MIKEKSFKTDNVEIGETEVLVGLLADEIEKRMGDCALENRDLVLGLATGSTPIPLYAELVRRHQEEGLSFANVVSFNLDEYEGIPAEHPESYRSYMGRHLVDHVDMRKECVFLPNANAGDPEKEGREYEERIREYGGIDFQILGIGRDGHIGFNEPGSGRETRTRRVKLAAETREDAAPAFGGIGNVPTHAMTMGVATILEAKRIVLIARGSGKREIVKKAMTGPVGPEVTASFLQDHADVTWYLDGAAAGE